MNKKGQVTTFIILGIVLVVIAFIVFYFFGEILTKEKKEVMFDESEIEPLKNYVEECIKLNGDEGLELIGKNGGDIDFSLYKMYHDEMISYLCYTEEYSSCYNRRPFLEKHIEDELNVFMLERLMNCVDLDLIRSEGYTVTDGEMVVDTSIGEEVVIINVNYPVTISKGNDVIKEERFSETFNIPLGKLIKTVNDIIDYESHPNLDPIMEFDVLTYMIRYLGEIEISVDVMENSRIYFINKKNDDYVFRFATQKWVN
ncbi:MAG: hypothetical protein KJ674_01675 [Nanoarchaeota archaeon]|nr:hypothetical protein [Nanoarchaeota archaeon]